MEGTGRAEEAQGTLDLLPSLLRQLQRKSNLECPADDPQLSPTRTPGKGGREGTSFSRPHYVPAPLQVLKVLALSLSFHLF